MLFFIWLCTRLLLSLNKILRLGRGKSKNVVFYLALPSPVAIFVAEMIWIMKHTKGKHYQEQGTEGRCANASRNRVVCLLLFVAGLLMLGGGVYGLVSLSKASDSFGHARGVIDRLSSKREYRHRKIRTRWEMRISYETERYGKTYVSEKRYLPFRSEGDSIEVLYNPGNPYDVRIPGDERCVWFTLLGVGLLCLSGGWLMLRPQRRTGRQCE